MHSTRLTLVVFASLLSQRAFAVAPSDFIPFTRADGSTALFRPGPASADVGVTQTRVTVAHPVKFFGSTYTHIQITDRSVLELLPFASAPTSIVPAPGTNDYSSSTPSNPVIGVYQSITQATNVTDDLLPTVEDEGSILYRTSTASADLALAEQHIRNSAAHTAAGFVATEIFSVMFFQMGRPVQSPYYDLIQLGIEAGLDPLEIGNSYQVLFVSGVDDRGFPATYLLYLYPGGTGVWDTIFFPDDSTGSFLAAVGWVDAAGAHRFSFGEGLSKPAKRALLGDIEFTSNVGVDGLYVWQVDAVPPSPTPSPTPTSSPTASASASASGTASASPTSGVSPSASPSSMGTVTASPTSTASASTDPSVSAAPSTPPVAPDDPCSGPEPTCGPGETHGPRCFSCDCATEMYSCVHGTRIVFSTAEGTVCFNDRQIFETDERCFGNPPPQPIDLCPAGYVDQTLVCEGGNCGTRLRACIDAVLWYQEVPAGTLCFEDSFVMASDPRCA